MSVEALRKIATTAGKVAGRLAGCGSVGSVAVAGGTVAVVIRTVAKEEGGSAVAVDQRTVVGVLASVVALVCSLVEAVGSSPRSYQEEVVSLSVCSLVLPPVHTARYTVYCTGVEVAVVDVVLALSFQVAVVA